MNGHEEVFISLRNGRAFISRYIAESDGSFTWESALNAIELEADALAAIKAQGGLTEEYGDYACPPELAARARWYHEE
jgi:hypothetical protein